MSDQMVLDHQFTTNDNVLNIINNRGYLFEPKYHLIVGEVNSHIELLKKNLTQIINLLVNRKHFTDNNYKNTSEIVQKITEFQREYLSLFSPPLKKNYIFFLRSDDPLVL